MKMTNYWMGLQSCLNSAMISIELFKFWKEELCQCPIARDFIKEHDRLIREFATFKQEEELNWASIQSFRTLSSKFT